MASRPGHKSGRFWERWCGRTGALASKSRARIKESGGKAGSMSDGDALMVCQPKGDRPACRPVEVLRISHEKHYMASSGYPSNANFYSTVWEIFSITLVHQS